MQPAIDELFEIDFPSQLFLEGNLRYKEAMNLHRRTHHISDLHRVL